MYAMVAYAIIDSVLHHQASCFIVTHSMVWSNWQKWAVSGLSIFLVLRLEWCPFILMCRVSLQHIACHTSCVVSSTVMCLIIQTIQLFEHPRFPGKIINFCIPNIRTPTFEIIIPISEHLHLAELTECLLAYYRHFQTYTRLLQSFPNIYYTPTVTAELERGLLNVYLPSTVFAELKRGLEKPSTVYGLA